MRSLPRASSFPLHSLLQQISSLTTTALVHTATWTTVSCFYHLPTDCQPEAVFESRQLSDELSSLPILPMNRHDTRQQHNAPFRILSNTSTTQQQRPTRAARL